jgi:hypothetical protein
MADALSDEHYAIRQQAIANEDPSASAWLTASHAWPENQMNDIAFRTSFLLNLLPVRTEKWCHCGKEMDSLASHMFVCSNRSTLNQIRNTIHAKLCRAVKTAQMYPLNALCSDAPVQNVPVDNPGDNPGWEKSWFRIFWRRMYVRIKHVDTMGPFQVPSLTGSLYAVHLTELSTKFRWIYFVKKRIQ